MPPQNTVPDSSTPDAQPAQVPPVISQQPPNVLVGGGFSSQSDVPPQVQKPRKRTAYIISGAALLIITSALLVLFLQIIPARQTAEFSRESKSILSKLSNEVDKLHDNNFIKATNRIADYDKAQVVLEEHMQDLAAARAAISKLKRQYTALHPTKRNASEKEKADSAFKIAGSIERKFQASLDFRQATFDAYGNLPNELNSYVENYGKGGHRPEFIAQTQTIKDLSEAALGKMAQVEVEKDDAELYELRLQYLRNTKDTFSKVNQYYRAIMDKQANQELSEYSNRSILLNDSIKQALEKYVTESSLANDFQAFDELLDR